MPESFLAVFGCKVHNLAFHMFQAASSSLFQLFAAHCGYELFWTSGKRGVLTIKQHPKASPPNIKSVHLCLLFIANWLFAWTLFTFVNTVRNCDTPTAVCKASNDFTAQNWLDIVSVPLKEIHAQPTHLWGGGGGATLGIVPTTRIGCVTFKMLCTFMEWVYAIQNRCHTVLILPPSSLDHRRLDPINYLPRGYRAGSPERRQ